MIVIKNNRTTNCRVAILYICTGKYKVLWKDFYLSSEKYFCPNSIKEYFVFTDADILEYEEDGNSRIHKIYQEAQPWPYPTLLRFAMFRAIKSKLEKYDYIFFFNANAQVLVPITEEMILPRKERREKLVVAKHPTYNWSTLSNPYDRNPKCRAYIPYGLGKLYVQACILGGTAKAFLKMTKKLSAQIDKDIKKGIIALWHDESYVNRYILFRKDYRLLGREFVRQKICEGKKNIILMRPKELYFDVKSIKENSVIAEPTKRFKKHDYYSYRLAEKIIECKKRAGDKQCPK